MADKKEYFDLIDVKRVKFIRREFSSEFINLKISIELEQK